jgi:hypothetical protein
MSPLVIAHILIHVTLNLRMRNRLQYLLSQERATATGWRLQIHVVQRPFLQDLVQEAGGKRSNLAAICTMKLIGMVEMVSGRRKKGQRRRFMG